MPNDKTIHVGPLDPTRRTSAIQPEPIPAAEPTLCYYNGQPFSPGSTICMQGQVMVCSPNGFWNPTGKSCPPDPEEQE